MEPPCNRRRERRLKTQDFIDKLFSFPTDECVIWPFARINKGYAKFTRNGHTLLVHRELCILVNGSPPNDKHHAAHTCGKGKQGCVNPLHVVWKTPQQNEEDKHVHGTHTSGKKRRFLRLTEEEQKRMVRLRSEGFTYVTLSLMFGITRNTVRKIVERKYNVK